MKICTNCGVPVEDDELFCGECGVKQELNQEKEEVTEAAICTDIDTAADKDIVEKADENTDYLHSQEPARESEEITFCSKCGSKNSAGDLFCMNCGTNLNEEEEEDSAPNKPAKGPINKRIIAGAAFVAIVAVGVKIFGGISGGTSEKLVYNKDNSNIQYTIENKKSLEITDRATENKAIYEIRDSLGEVRYSEDGKYVFYSEKLDDDGVGTLMYKNLKKQSSKKDTSEKLDSNVRGYRLLSSGKVLYSKGSYGDMNLYLSDLKDKTKIGSGITNYIVSKDESCLIFMTDDDEIYSYNLKKNASKDKLDSEASFICASNDLKYIYYTKDEKLMCIKNLKDKEKVASDFYGNWAFAEGGKSIYYMLPKEEYMVTDFITDDYKIADSKTKKPIQSDYRVASGTNWYGGTTYTIDAEKYNLAVKAYNKKIERDEIRNRLDNLGSVILNELYLYDGKESTKISDTVLAIEAGPYTYKDSTDKVVCVSQVDIEELGGYDLSLIDYASDVADKIAIRLKESKKYYLVTGTNMNQFDVDRYISSTQFDFDNHAFYYTDDEQEDGTVTLHAISYSEKSIKSTEKIADDVSGIILLNGKIGYWSDYNNGDATLNISGDEIDEDVSTNGFTPVSTKEDDSIYYAKDLSDKDRSFTLYRYQKGKSVKIDDDIISFKPLEGGKVAYLQDYNLDKYRGDLCIWISEKKQYKIDDDVSYIKGGYGHIN